VEQCDHESITLTDLTPANGQLVLSYHYQSGIKASVERVKVEKEPQVHDAIPFVRLRFTAPLARLTLYWTPD
jgi:hypothetical protein